MSPLYHVSSTFVPLTNFSASIFHLGIISTFEGPDFSTAKARQLYYVLHEEQFVTTLLDCTESENNWNLAYHELFRKQWYCLESHILFCQTFVNIFLIRLISANIFGIALNEIYKPGDHLLGGTHTICSTT